MNEDIREIIEELRTENAKLMVELVDSRTLLGLNAEQVMIDIGLSVCTVD